MLKADYSNALSMLLRYPSPQTHPPQSFVHDALYLEQNPTAERGSFLVSKYSGREPDSSKRHSRFDRQPARRAHLWDEFRNRSESSSPVVTPPRNSPKSLEALFQDVSQGIQRRTESWGVAKTIRGAVTEARKNMQTMHYESSPRVAPPKPKPSASVVTPTDLALGKKIRHLEERNQTLASALGHALNDIRSQLAVTKDVGSTSNDTIKQALAQAESVHGCLEDPSRPLPVVAIPETPTVDGESVESALPPPEAAPRVSSEPGDQQDAPQVHADATGSNTKSETSQPDSNSHANPDRHTHGRREGPKSNTRPSLADAGFSWMLEGSQNHLSSFVSSASVPPEQTRHQEQPRPKGSPLFGSGGEDKKPGTGERQDELALRSLRGSRGPL